MDNPIWLEKILLVLGSALVLLTVLAHLMPKSWPIRAKILSLVTDVGRFVALFRKDSVDTKAEEEKARVRREKASVDTSLDVDHMTAPLKPHVGPPNPDSTSKTGTPFFFVADEEELPSTPREPTSTKVKKSGEHKLMLPDIPPK